MSKSAPEIGSLPPVALMFPGQGSQSVGMGREYLEVNGPARQVFEEADEVLGWPVSVLCRHGPESELNRTEKAQPALLTLSVAIWRDLQEKIDLPVAVCLGHSAGEYAALVAAGAIDFADALRCIARRGEFMAAAGADGIGGMAAVIGLAADSVHAVCQQVRENEVLGVANLNAPGQVVISGHNAALTRAEPVLRGAGAQRVVRLRVTVPCHSALMDKAAGRLAEVLAGITFRPPLVPVLSNVTAEPHCGPDSIRARLAEQVIRPVRWEDCVRWTIGHGCRGFVELGSGGILVGLLRRIDRSLKARLFDRPLASEQLTGGSFF